MKKLVFLIFTVTATMTAATAQPSFSKPSDAYPANVYTPKGSPVSDTWRMLYSGMFSSKINNNVTLTDPETVFDLIDNATHSSAVPVAMMHYQYNALNENFKIQIP